MSDKSDELDGNGAAPSDEDRRESRIPGSAIASSNTALRRLKALHSQLDAFQGPRLTASIERLLRAQESIALSIPSDIARLTRGINAAIADYAVVEPAIQSAVRAAVQAGSFALSPGVLEQVRQLQARNEQLLDQVQRSLPQLDFAELLQKHFEELDVVRRSVPLEKLPNLNNLTQMYSALLQEYPFEVGATDVAAAPSPTAETLPQRTGTTPSTANYALWISIFLSLFQIYLSHVGSNRVLAELQQLREVQHEDSQRTQELLEQEVAAPLQRIEEFTGAILSLLLAESDGEELALGPVAVREAPVRSAPNSKAVEISRVFPGQVVRVVSRAGTWLYVGFFGQDDGSLQLGWLNQRHLKSYSDDGGSDAAGGVGKSPLGGPPHSRKVVKP